MAKKRKDKEMKWVKPKMKFNYGRMKYEPELPLEKVNKKQPVKIGLGWIFYLMIIIAVIWGVLFLAKKYGVI